MSSREMVADAYNAHQKIYGNELDEKIKSLPEDQNDDQAKSELEKLRDAFFNKMSEIPQEYPSINTGNFHYL